MQAVPWSAEQGGLGCATLAELQGTSLRAHSARTQ